MSRIEFMSKLDRELSGLPFEERQAAIKYYEEYFEEAGIEREPEILTELGDPVEVAKAILANYSSVPETTARSGADAGSCYYRDADYRRVTGERAAATVGSNATSEQQAGYKEMLDWRYWSEKWNLPGWVFIVILICALPLLGGIASTLISIAFGLGATVAGAVFSVFIFIVLVAMGGFVTIVAGAAVLIFGLTMMMAAPALGILCLGFGLMLIAVGIIIGIISKRVGGLLPVLINGIVRICKSIVKAVKSLLSKSVSR